MVRAAQRLVIGRIPKQRVIGTRDWLDVIHLRGETQFPLFVEWTQSGFALR